MKKLTILILALVFSILAIIFTPIVYDYFTNRSYGSDPTVEVDHDARKMATFAGGCFWCMEPPFEEIEGVDETIVGYIGGEEENPTYEEVAGGETSHAEAVQIMYDSTMVSYEDLLQVFWRQIDPTDADGQFVDRGKQYRSAIFYHNEEQKQLAEASKQELADSERFESPLMTEIEEATTFYRAEEYHQNYAKKNPVRYKFYRSNSGRDEFLDHYWEDAEREHEVAEPNEEDVVFWRRYEKEDEDTIKERLTEKQFYVTQEDGTETAYDNEYWDHYEDGIYVDLLSGEPLFSSTHQYDSKTGWPSFTQPILEGNIVEKEDRHFFVIRTEVRSTHGDSHLGHVFNDGPEPTGLRYCINSAAINFIAKEDMEALGYHEFLYLFEE